MSAFAIDHRKTGSTIRVFVRGELDADTGPRLDDVLRRVESERPPTLVLDLSGVSFFDSTGLQIVLDSDLRARETKRRFVVVPGAGEPLRVLELADVTARLDLDDPGD